MILRRNKMKKVLITGGNGDIAKSIVELLSLNSTFQISSPTRSELDVTDISSIESYLKNYIPDVLINNAGFIKIHALINGPVEEDIKTIDVNLSGVFRVSHLCLKKNPNIQIINIGSSAGTKVHPEWAAYCASKAGLIMATKCWAEEGVNTVCISPGRTLTKMRSSLFQNENPKSLMKTEDFAKIVLKAIQNKYQNGINIDVNVNNIGDLLK
jgi:NAD(P)-dependent dehydrogenase (short-subunit alcohol dehydrogenase family)